MAAVCSASASTLLGIFVTPLLVNLLGERAPWLVGLLAVCALAAMESTASAYMATAGGLLGVLVQQRTHLAAIVLSGHQPETLPSPSCPTRSPSRNLAMPVAKGGPEAPLSVKFERLDPSRSATHGN